MNPLTSTKNNQSQTLSTKSADNIIENQQIFQENSTPQAISASTGKANTEATTSRIKAFLPHKIENFEI